RGRGGGLLRRAARSLQSAQHGARTGGAGRGDGDDGGEAGSAQPGRGIFPRRNYFVRPVDFAARRSFTRCSGRGRGQKKGAKRWINFSFFSIPTIRRFAS